MTSRLLVRFSDVDTDLGHRPPLVGYEETPDMGVGDALAHAGVKGAAAFAQIALEIAEEYAHAHPDPC